MKTTKIFLPILIFAVSTLFAGEPGGPRFQLEEMPAKTGSVYHFELYSSVYHSDWQSDASRAQKLALSDYTLACEQFRQSLKGERKVPIRGEKVPVYQSLGKDLFELISCGAPRVVSVQDETAFQAHGEVSFRLVRAFPVLSDKARRRLYRVTSTFALDQSYPDALGADATQTKGKGICGLNRQNGRATVLSFCEGLRFIDDPPGGPGAGDGIGSFEGTMRAFVYTYESPELLKFSFGRDELVKLGVSTAQNVLGEKLVPGREVAYRVCVPPSAYYDQDSCVVLAHPPPNNPPVLQQAREDRGGISDAFR